MIKIVYPAVLEQDKTNSVWVMNFQDLNLVTTGLSVEDAFKSSCTSLKTYLTFAMKFDANVPDASKYEDAKKMNPKKDVLLVCVEIDETKLKIAAQEDGVSDFVRGLFE